MKGYRTLDWRFWVALTGCLMVTYLVVGGYQDNVRKGKRIDSLIHAAQAADAQQAAADARASEERQDLLRNQARLLRLYRHQVRRQEALDERLAALLAYLRAHGIQVPAEFQAANLPGRPPPRRPHAAELTGNPPVTGGGQGHPKDPGPGAPIPDLGTITDLLNIPTSTERTAP